MDQRLASCFPEIQIANRSQVMEARGIIAPNEFRKEREALRFIWLPKLFQMRTDNLFTRPVQARVPTDSSTQEMQNPPDLIGDFSHVKFSAFRRSVDKLCIRFCCRRGYFCYTVHSSLKELRRSVMDARKLPDDSRIIPSDWRKVEPGWLARPPVGLDRKIRERRQDSPVPLAAFARRQ